jgi:hypothetical protein
MHKQFVKLTLFGVVAMLLSEQISASTYSLDGTITYQTYKLGPNGELLNDKPLNRTFTALVDGNRWKIKTILAGNPNFDYFLYSYDGTNLCYYCKHSSNANIVASSPTITSSNFLETIIVETSPAPKTITSAAGEYVWLAFASGSYFKGLTNNLVSDFIAIKSKNSGYMFRQEVPCNFSLSPFPPFLITNADFFQNQFVTSSSEFMTNSLDKPFDLRFLLAEYKSDDFTNISGITIPKTFKYIRYAPVANAGHSYDKTPIFTVLGVVNNVSLDVEKWVNEIPKQNAVVYDKRSSVPNVLYITTNGSIPSTNSRVVTEAHLQGI